MLDSKKAQVFVQDLIIAIAIMSMVILIFFSFYTNQNIGGESDDQAVLSEAMTISDYLTTSGYPKDWNETTVVRIGLIDDNYALKTEKLEMFSNMTRDNYNLVQSLLKTKYDYLVFFQDYDGNILNVSDQMFIGKSGVNSTNIEEIESPTHLSRISRFMVFKEGQTNTTARIIEMVTYVYSKER